MTTLSNLRPHRGSALVLGCALVLAACASATPPPNERMAVATAAVAHAAAAGGPEFAPVEMRMARDKLQRATVAMTGKDHATADSLAEQAQLDAQLAEAKAESAKARKAADAVSEGSRVLREELDRKAK
jgi:membrane-bound lytic murein transglycosylase B